jgi:hypothetical protein
MLGALNTAGRHFQDESSETPNPGLNPGLFCGTTSWSKLLIRNNDYGL